MAEPLTPEMEAAWRDEAQAPHHPKAAGAAWQEYSLVQDGRIIALLAALDAERQRAEAAREEREYHRRAEHEAITKRVAAERERDAARSGEARAVLDRDRALSAQVREGLRADRAERERDAALARAVRAEAIASGLWEAAERMHSDAEIAAAARWLHEHSGEPSAESHVALAKASGWPGLATAHTPSARESAESTAEPSWSADMRAAAAWWSRR